MNKQYRQIKDRLIKLAREQNTPYEKLATAFLLERLAQHLVSDAILSEKLVFKGGYVSLRVYHSPRFTIDLDAALVNSSLGDLRDRIIKTAESNLNDATWFKFEKSTDLETLGEYGGIRFQFRAGIGERPKSISRAQIVELDIATGDPITPGPVQMQTESLANGAPISWLVYPIETVVAEKLHTLVVRGSENSRAKDIYDLHIFLPQCDLKTLKTALQKTARARGDDLPSNLATAVKAIDTTLLQQGWKSAIAGIRNAPGFSDAFDTIAVYAEKLA